MTSEGDVPEPETPRRTWQGRESAATAETRASRRRFKIIIVAGVLSALLAAVVILVNYLRVYAQPAPDFLAINIPEHTKKHFPLRPFARADKIRLMRHFDNKKDATPVTRDPLLAQLKALKSRSTAPLVIHLTAPALVRDDMVYFLPGDAEPDNDATWLSVDVVFKALEERPDKQNLLLILDLAHGLVDPRLGAPADRVAETLQAYLEKEKPSFLVLCPCSAGQSSLTSEVLRSSVLAYYLDQGLLGDAQTDKNAGISVQELFKYVKTKVDQWARNNRGVHQEPRLFGDGDFIIMPARRPALDPMGPVAPDPYPKELLEAWTKLDESRKRGMFRQTPRLLLRLEANLLRDEARWRAGTTSKGFSFDQETRQLIGNLTDRMATPMPAPLLVSVLRAKENAAAAEAISIVLQRVSDEKKIQAQIAGILKENKIADDPQTMRAVVDALTQIPMLKKEHLRAARAIMAGSQGKDRYVEVVYVDRLLAFADREIARLLPDAKIEDMWRTMCKREAVFAALVQEPEFLFPWIDSALKDAEKTQRIAEGKLLWERPPVWKEAQRELQSSFNAYKKVKQALDEMQAGSAALDRAFADLPIHLRILGDGPDTDRYAEQVWLKAAEEAAILQRVFVVPPDEQKVADAKLDSHARELQHHLDELQRLLRVRIKNAEKADTATAQRQMHLLLHSPRFEAKNRAELITNLQLEAKKLHDTTESIDAPLPKLGERNTGNAHAQMSLALLGLAGIEPGSSGFPLPAGKEQRSMAARDKTLHQMWGASGLVARWAKEPDSCHGRAASRLMSAWDPEPKFQDYTRVWQTKLRDWLKEQYDLESLEAGPREQKANDPRDQEIREFYLEAAR